MKRIASLVAAAAATAIFAGFTHAAELPSVHAAAAARCRTETVRHVRYSECESRAGDVVTYTYTETTTWRVS